MPLEDKSTWTKPKTWVLPVMITVMVDDPEKYDSQMQTMIDRLINELRSVAKNFDKSGKQLTLRSGASVKNVSVEEVQLLLDMGFKNNLTDKEADKINNQLEEIKAMIVELQKRS